jgi:hypothetical protein
VRGSGRASRFGFLQEFLHFGVEFLFFVVGQRETGDKRSRHDKCREGVTDAVFHNVLLASLLIGLCDFSDTTDKVSRSGQFLS